jgi:hypothetical protein
MDAVYQLQSTDRARLAIRHIFRERQHSCLDSPLQIMAVDFDKVVHSASPRYFVFLVLAKEGMGTDEVFAGFNFLLYDSRFSFADLF